MGRGGDGQGFKKKKESVCSFLKAATEKNTGERTKKNPNRLLLLQIISRLSY